MLVTVGTTVTLSAQIIQLLITSKGNKQEHKSLHAAVTNIHRFLQAVECHPDGVSAEGYEVLKQLHAQLLEIHALLVQVGNMSTLVSLIKATVVRDDFLRTNRDLISTFSILAQGEQLLRGAQNRSQDLTQITYDLQRSQSEFFVQEEARHSRLVDVASQAKRNQVPEQLLQRELREQLNVWPEVAGLEPEELLSEFRALQEHVLASYGSQGDVPRADTGRRDQNSTKKKFNSESEEFLLQQVCAAIAATVCATSPETLQLDAPNDYLCPISKQLMVQPVMLVETGHTYEAESIQKWLVSNDVCPVSGRKLSSKQTSPNYSLKRVIADWAAAHSVTPSPAPVYHAAAVNADLSNTRGSAAATAVTLGVTAAPAAESSVLLRPALTARAPAGAAAAPVFHGSSQFSAPPAPGASTTAIAGKAFTAPKRSSRKGGRKGGGQGPCRCTRSRWAIGAIALLLLVALGVGLGVGLPKVIRTGKGVNSTSGNSGAAAVQGPPGNSTPTAPQATQLPQNTSSVATEKGTPSGSPCDKCNLPETSGGCKCDNNCNCIGKSTQDWQCLYTIESGDSFGKLAQETGVDVNAIQAANPGVKPESLFVGQKIRFPCPGGSAPAPPGASVAATEAPNPSAPVQSPSEQTALAARNRMCGTHTVKSGDTFWQLAQSSGVDLSALEAANPGVQPENLFVGQMINLPCPAVPPGTPGRKMLQSCPDTFAACPGWGPASCGLPGVTDFCPCMCLGNGASTPAPAPPTPTTPPPIVDPTVPGPPTSAPDGTGGGVAQLVTAAMWDELFPNRNNAACQGAAGNFYNYYAFLTAAAAFPAFGTSSNDPEVNKRELSAFLGQVSQETTGGWDTAPGGPYAWGLCFTTEGGDKTPQTAPYCEASTAFPCAAGKKYFGRGPMQLSWNYNYIPAGRALGFDGLNNPEVVATDPVIAFKTAIWFWMTPQPPKPSCHDVMAGRWIPSAQDTAAGRAPGYGMVTNIINGGLECGKGTVKAKEQGRIGFYTRHAGILGVSVGSNLDCANQRSF